MVKQHRGSSEWNRIQAKLRCSLPSAELVSLQRVENQKLWRAFEGPVTEYRDAGGHVRLGHYASGVKEVCVLALCVNNITSSPRQSHCMSNTVTMNTWGSGHTAVVLCYDTNGGTLRVSCFLSVKRADKTYTLLPQLVRPSPRCSYGTPQVQRRPFAPEISVSTSDVRTNMAWPKL